ncbi:hypothetical protein VO56_02190 [Mycoplasmopsis gallinacea]|uniref:Uncharacterized protein n=1 Tax=Mycoplasmopsis gallinacea TaxID=29556 RepID=A0A0D5ZJI3_9BACT|nr:hypothetical protein VO56_02190 [Mycoplasmopsis gallinacea]
MNSKINEIKEKLTNYYLNKAETVKDYKNVDFYWEIDDITNKHTYLYVNLDLFLEKRGIYKGKNYFKEYFNYYQPKNTGLYHYVHSFLNKLKEDVNVERYFLFDIGSESFWTEIFEVFKENEKEKAILRLNELNEKSISKEKHYFKLLNTKEMIEFLNENIPELNIDFERIKKDKSYLKYQLEYFERVFFDAKYIENDERLYIRPATIRTESYMPSDFRYHPYKPTFFLVNEFFHPVMDFIEEFMKKVSFPERFERHFLNIDKYNFLTKEEYNEKKMKRSGTKKWKKLDHKQSTLN